MNNISEIQPRTFHRLHLLSELCSPQLGLSRSIRNSHFKAANIAIWTIKCYTSAISNVFAICTETLRRTINLYLTVSGCIRPILTTLKGIKYCYLHTAPIVTPKLRISGNQLRYISGNALEGLHNLRVLRLDANLLSKVPAEALRGVRSLRHLWLDDNSLTEIPVMALDSLPSLQAMTLALNQITHIPDYAFTNLSGLVVLVIEMPYAYQCCIYASCNSYKPTTQWDTELSNTNEDLHKRTVAMYPVHADTNCPFRPCDSLLGSWLVRVGLWSISLVSLLGNAILFLSLFGSPGSLSPLRFIVACMGASNLLMGVCTCTLVLVDAFTLGEFSDHGARWEAGPGCQATGWVWVFASEASVLLLTLAAVQCGVSVTCARAYGKSPSLGSVRTCACFCLTISLTLASLPLFGVGEYGSSPFCLPSPLPTTSRLPSSMGFPLALIMMNTVCLLIVTGSYIRLYWELLRGECEGLWDCAMIKHVAWLIFTNGLLYVPVAFISLCSLLGLLSLGEEVLKSVLLLLQPLPACLNPLLFLLFTRDHFQLFSWSRPKACPQLRRDRTLDSLVSVETEKSSYSDSTQVSLTDADATYSAGSSLQPGLDSIRFSQCSSTSAVHLIPCQVPTVTARERERVTE
ncbi:hypothetical protein GOODEAATRI_000661 [Goodea atripinnis]|uniref:G-protein coupled receptors family 1 profile domain-containing protein n=1 Tax=Goodea atripinnis TaxID=208336 RepID=A0ABV0P0A0_9TELE